MKDVIDDPYVGGYPGIVAEYERRGLKAPTRQTIHRMINKIDEATGKSMFPAPTPLGMNPNSPRGKKDWKRSTIARWFDEREAQATKAA